MSSLISGRVPAVVGEGGGSDCGRTQLRSAAIPWQEGERGTQFVSSVTGCHNWHKVLTPAGRRMPLGPSGVCSPVLPDPF